MGACFPDFGFGLLRKIRLFFGAESRAVVKEWSPGEAATGYNNFLLNDLREIRAAMGRPEGRRGVRCRGIGIILGVPDGKREQREEWHCR